jgi:hypothetical protein
MASQSLVETITGGYCLLDDVTIIVEPYDVDVTLMTVTVDGRTYPIELSDHNALKLSAHLAKGR